ncbi:MAG: DUF6489 family protein [Erythrobacter sp.]|uniref:DUF6489 family protein n=1 Tax=Erythrobacter sp. Alg231-14 TaxID=1922225 RepID=UPI000D55A57D
MKINVEVECTPEEARSFMGLPDVSQANSVYVDTISKAMKGVKSPDQLQEYAQALAPMGQMGMKLFQSFVEGGMRNATGGGSSSSSGGSKGGSSD